MRMMLFLAGFARTDLQTVGENEIIDLGRSLFELPQGAVFPVTSTWIQP